MDWTGHCACIGAITALQYLGHGDTMLNHMACKSLTSGTSELYKLRTMGAMCRAQAHMATADVTIIRDTFGSLASAARPAGAQATAEQALHSVGSLAFTTVDHAVIQPSHASGSASGSGSSGFICPSSNRTISVSVSEKLTLTLPPLFSGSCKKRSTGSGSVHNKSININN